MTDDWSQVEYPTIETHRPEWLDSIIDDIQLPYSETTQSDALVFLVDASQSMRRPIGGTSDSNDSEKVKDEDDKKQTDITLFKTLNIVENAIRNKMLSSPADYISVILFGTEHKSVDNNPNNSEHIYIINALEQPSTTLIKHIQQLQLPAYYDSHIGSHTASQLDRALWSAALLFNQKQTALRHVSKRILIITNNDYPLDQSDRSSRNRCLQKARDLRENNVSIQTVPVLDGSGDTKFDPQKLLIQIENVQDDTDVLLPDKLKQFQTRTSEALTDLQTQVSSKVFKKRSLGTVELSIATDLSVSVNVYALLHEAKKESPVQLDKRTNTQLKADTKYVDADTGDYVNQQQMKKYVVYAGEKVYFTDDEIKSIKSIGNVGLTLMGFKPSSTLVEQHNLRAPYFIYPTEAIINGSTLLFHTLLNAMHELDQVAICRFQYRKTSIARFVALMPQLEETDERGNQVTPPGMHLIFLPYTDDIRDVQVPPQSISDEQQIRACKTVIDRLTNIHELPVINNPVLMRHNAVVQAIALDENVDQIQTLADETMPDVEGMKQKHSAVIESFKQSVYGDGDGGAVKSTPKRATKRDRDGDADADNGGSATKAKKEKTGDDEEAYNAIDWAAEAHGNKLTKRTVPVLKLYLKHNQLQQTGKKQELVDRIVQHLLS